jgi:hypothetical protein
MVEDITESFCLSAALDAADHAALVIDSQGRVRAVNNPALGLFTGATPGVRLLRELNEVGPRACWWEPGLGGRRKSLIEISRRAYEVTSSTVELPGDQEVLFVLAFRPVAALPMANRAERQQDQTDAGLFESSSASRR